MEIYEKIELGDCPRCGGAGLLEQEGEHSFYVACMECGSNTVTVSPKNGEDLLATAQRAADLWNYGKVISPDPGE